MFSMMPVREFGLFEPLSLNWVMFAISSNEHGNDLFWYLDYITVKSLTYWWSLLILRLFPEFSLQIHSLQPLANPCHRWLCVCWCRKKQHPVGILDSFILLSTQVSSSSSCDLFSFLLNLCTLSSDSVSKPVHIHFHVFTCTLGYACLAPRSYL